MNFIDELKSRRDLLKDPENLKPVGRKAGVFERLQEDKDGKLGEQLYALDNRRYQAQGSCANRC